MARCPKSQWTVVEQTTSILSQIDDFLAMAGPPVLPPLPSQTRPTPRVTHSHLTETAWTLSRAASDLAGVDKAGAEMWLPR
jgi:hypothetical protein